MAKYGIAQFKLYIRVLVQMCWYTHVPAHLLYIRLKNLACTYIVAHNFDMRMIVSEHTRHSNDAHHKFTLGLPHYMCGVQVQWIHIDNEMHRFCSLTASSSILQLMKYMGMSLLINT